jgi:hypothetical protein
MNPELVAVVAAALGALVVIGLSVRPQPARVRRSGGPGARR